MRQALLLYTRAYGLGRCILDKGVLPILTEATLVTETGLTPNIQNEDAFCLSCPKCIMGVRCGGILWLVLG